MYQIFPDRFARDGSATAQRGMEHHRRMGQTVHYHADWDEPVEWQANTPEGEYAPVDFYGGTLRGIADRLSVVDGRLFLSSPPGGPTILTVEVPCA